MFRRRSRTPRPSDEVRPGQATVHRAVRLNPAGRAGHGSTVLRRSLAGVSAAAVLGAGLAVADAVTAGAATPNLVANPGFENGLSGWTCTGGSGTAVSSPVHSGASALRAMPTGQDSAQCTQTVGVQPNSQYTLSAYVLGSYVYLGATGTGLTGTTSTWTPSSPSYGQLNVAFTTGPSTTSVTVYLHGWYGQPAYLADDVSLAGPVVAAPRRLSARRRPPVPRRRPARRRRPAPRRPRVRRRPAARRVTPAPPSPGRRGRSSRATGRTGTAPPTASTPVWGGSPSLTAGSPRTATTSSTPPSR